MTGALEFTNSDLFSKDEGKLLLQNTCLCLCVLLSSLARFPFLEMEWNFQMQGRVKALEVYYWYYLASAYLKVTMSCHFSALGRKYEKQLFHSNYDVQQL